MGDSIENFYNELYGNGPALIRFFSLLRMTPRGLETEY